MPRPLRYEDPKLQDILASNYVIGTLRGKARKRFEQLMAQDHTIAERVIQWETKLQPIHTATQPVPPKKATWKMIASQINNTSNQMVEKLLSKLRLYQYLTAFAFSLSMVVSLASYLSYSESDPINTINYVAVLKNDIEQPVMVATLKKTGRLLALDLLQKPNVAQDNDIQIWAISKDDGSIKSLGLIDVAKRVELQLTKPEWGLIKSAEFLMVSIESKGGSTTGLPSERLISKGLCVQVQGWQDKTS